MDVRILLRIFIVVRHANFLVDLGLKPRFIAVVIVVIKRHKKPNNKTQ